MLSGIVYFEEIVENVKDATGYENLRPFYDKIRRFIFNAERKIGASGFIVRKSKEFTSGDGFYDGNTIIMPTDFVSEDSCGDLSDGELHGNILTLNNTGPAEIVLRYMGFLLDNNGNPITTRNHMDAVVAYCVYRLYSSRYFLGKGNRNQNNDYKIEWQDCAAGARADDAFPTEEEWANIGKTMLGGTFEALTDCGISTVTPLTSGAGSSIPSIINPIKLLDQNIVEFVNQDFVATKRIIWIKAEKPDGAMVDLLIIAKSGDGFTATISHSETITGATIFIYTES